MVEVARISDLLGGSNVELIGEIESATQAVIQSEASGRVTSVNVSLGDSVGAGQVIGQVENASERASLLQAQGTYEAALASAAQNESGAQSAQTSLTNALNSGLTTYRNALSATENVIRNTVDMLFSDPGGNIPGFRLDALGRANELNATRTQIEEVLRNWLDVTLSNPSREQTVEILEAANNDLVAIVNFVDTVAQVVADENNDSRVINGVSIATIRNDLNTARSSMNTTKESVENALASISNAEDELQRAEIGGTNNEISASNAQVKQALGSLRAAEANLEKTIFRTSIGGTVNTLTIKTGDFVGMSVEVARVANNNAFEITTHVGENDRNRIAIGDEVLLEEGQTGIITSIAPAVDQTTRKIEIRISTESTSFASGSTVRISIPVTEIAAGTEELRVPITALKVETDRIIVFTVGADGLLTAHQVTEGPLLGNSIIIEEGVTSDMEIVVDARGLNEGDEVLVSNEGEV
jgi:multidrug efflux pump subunit AcrA (membrane-fusion protein)